MLVSKVRGDEAALVGQNHGTGSGDIPWTGVAGIGTGLLVLVVLVVLAGPLRVGRPVPAGRYAAEGGGTTGRP